MGYHEKVEEVRAFVRQTLLKLGSEQDQEMSESMLIRNGFFCGWRFNTENLEAVWFIEEREIKFLDQTGAVMEVADLSRDLSHHTVRHAA